MIPSSLPMRVAIAGDVNLPHKSDQKWRFLVSFLHCPRYRLLKGRSSLIPLHKSYFSEKYEHLTENRKNTSFSSPIQNSRLELLFTTPMHITYLSNILMALTYLWLIRKKLMIVVQ